MIEIKITGNSAAEALLELAQLAAHVATPAKPEPTALTTAPVEIAPAPEPKAEVKEPAPRRRRKTAEAPAAAPAAPVETPAPAAAEAPVAADPMQQEDPPEVQAQDAADEAAEAAEAGEENIFAEQTTPAEVTVDDLVALMKQYLERYGENETQIDGVYIFKNALGEPPGGKQYWSLSLVKAAGPEAITKAHTAWAKALAENPFKRTAKG